MRLFSGLLISTLAAGTILTTGCAEHRYQKIPIRIRRVQRLLRIQRSVLPAWLAERRYDYMEYNRLNRERQREYWEWRRQNEARFRNDPRFRDNDSRFRDRVVRNDHDADDRRRNDHDADDRGRTYARARNGDRDRHRDDRNRHDVRKNRDNATMTKTATTTKIMTGAS